MPRQVDPAQKRVEQLLLRLTAEEFDWLESAAHLERVTVNAYVYGLVQAHVTSLGTNAHVRADRENRSSYDDANAQARSIPRTRADIAFTDTNISGDTRQGAK